MIGRSCLSFKELSTLLTEVECVVNARPLAYVCDDLDGVNFALTPSHLINGRRLLNTPNSSHFEIVSTHDTLTRRSQDQKRLLNQFTAAWRKDYLVNLRETHTTNSRRKEGNLQVAVGDVVLLQNDSTKRALWKLAIVKELLAGSDGQVRAAVVRVADTGNLLKRSVKHLIPIEVKANVDPLPQPERSVRSEQGTVTVDSRPRRRAAIDGEILRRLRS